MRWYQVICETSPAMAHAFQAMIDTPEFQRWFAGSRIVNAHGMPLVVWHGLKTAKTHLDTLNKRVLFSPHFTTFKMHTQIEPGAWFSPDPAVAQHYGQPAPFFLRAVNPVQEESPITKPPIGHDAIYRMRSNRTNIWQAWEIAVFEVDQIRLAFDPSSPPL
jgi:hypothetical protein